MTLREYRNLAEQAEQQQPSEGLYVNAGLLRRQIETALWQPHCKAEAAELAARFRMIEENSAKAAGCA